MENIPPTSDALLQHAKRATYQATVWTSSHNVQQNRPAPESWGWEWDEHGKEWTPVWTTLPMASSVCMELVRCSCKSEKGCGIRCSCFCHALLYVNVVVCLETLVHFNCIFFVKFDITQ